MRNFRASEEEADLQQRSRLSQRFSWRKILVRVLSRMLLRLLLPFIVYQIVGSFFPISEWLRLCVSAMIPLGFFVWARLRTKRFDLLSALILSGLVILLPLALLMQDPRLLALREPLLHGFFGLICLGSLAFGQPLALKLYIFVIADEEAAQRRWFERTLMQEPSLRSTFRLVTVVGGCVLLVIAITHISLLYWSLGLHRSLLGTVLTSGIRFIDYGADILLGLWAWRKLTVAHSRLRARIFSLTTITQVLRAM